MSLEPMTMGSLRVSGTPRYKELEWEWRDTRDKQYQVSEFLRVSLRNKSFPMKVHANVYFTYFFNTFPCNWRGSISVSSHNMSLHDTNIQPIQP